MSELQADLPAVAPRSAAEGAPTPEAGSPPATAASTTAAVRRNETVDDRQRKLLDKLREQVGQETGRDVRMEVAVDQAGHYVVKILDTKTDKLLRQIPAEEVLKFAEHLNEYLGVVLDERA